MELTEISRPRVDIEMYGTVNNIAPIDMVRVMDEDTFEQFTLEWLYGSKKSQYHVIKRFGGAGDKGRDVVAYYEDGSVDYYQCKHYNMSLAPTNFYLELGKLCYYTYKKEIPTPNNYYLIASNDVGHSLQDMIDNPAELLSSLIENWEKYCKSKITKTIEIELDESMLDYIKSFDFSIIKTYPIAKIIDEYLNTIYGNIRFGGGRIDLPKAIELDEVLEAEELTYINALLEAYSEELKMNINTIEALKAYKTYFKHLNRQRKDYYSVETIRRFVRDTLTDTQQFEVLKEEIYNGIIDTHEKNYDSGYQRLVADLQQASQTNTSKSMLDSKLHCIGNSERKGACHMLVNDNRIRWVNEE